MDNDNIPAGYQVVITSWENDADHYKDQTFSGLSKEDAAFIIDLAKLFKSVNHHGDSGFGGSARHYQMNRKGSDYEEDLMDAWDAVVAKHPGISEAVRESFVPEERDFGYYGEMATELVHYPGEDYHDGYIRVFDDFKVFFFETEVKNVSKEFA